jgi:hypothetical protein
MLKMTSCSYLHGQLGIGGTATPETRFGESKPKTRFHVCIAIPHQSLAIQVGGKRKQSMNGALIGNVPPGFEVRYPHLVSNVFVKTVYIFGDHVIKDLPESDVVKITWLEIIFTVP